MIRTALTLAVLLAWPVVGHAQSLAITGPSRSGVLEGRSYRLTWSGSGLKSVSVVAYGERTPLGTRVEVTGPGG